MSGSFSSLLDLVPPSPEASRLEELKVSIREERLGIVLGGWLYEIRGSKTLPEADFSRLASDVPGAYWVSLRHGPLPIRGDGAWKFRSQTGGFPDPIYVPVSQRPALDAIVPGVPTIPVRGDPGILSSPLPFVLAPFQEFGVRRVIAERRGIFSAGIGSGKTAVALAVGETLLERKLIDRIVVSAPKSLIDDPWQKEWAKDYGRRPTVVDGSPARRRRIYREPIDPARWITKYDTFWGDAEWTKRLLGPRSFLVIDEIHHLKNPRSKRFREIRKLADGTATDYRLFLTGSLVDDKVVDLYGPISLLGLRTWGSFEEFSSRYFEQDRIAYERTLTDEKGVPLVSADGSKRVEGGVALVPGRLLPEKVAELRAVIGTVVEAPPADSIDLQLPPLKPKEIQVHMSLAETEAYEAVIATPLFEEVEIGDVTVTVEAERNLLSILGLERLFSVDPGALALSESERARSIVAAYGEDRWAALSPGSKLRALVRYLDELLEEDPTVKVVVFTSFERTLEVFRSAVDRADELGEDGEIFRRVFEATEFFYGGLSTAQRSLVLERFGSDPTRRILFSTDAGGEGLNLQAAASVVVINDDPLSLRQWEQRPGRVRRRGQTRSVLYTRFALAESEALWARLERLLPQGSVVDSRIRELLAVKRRERDLVMGRKG
jgi:superfamily II DNA or RNA helicase